MRTALVILAAAALAAAQDDAPGRTTAEEGTTWSFEFEQGWRLATVFNGRTTVSIDELTNGVDIPVMRHEPIVARGRATLGPDGHWRLRFDHIEYWDLTQRWTIDFTKDKVETRQLVVDRWKGTRAEWKDRVAELERIFSRGYLAVTTPQAPKEEERTGLVPGVAEIGKPLFVVGAMEEQFAALLLAKIDGRPLDADWERDESRYPERVRLAAAQIVDRLTAQCRGELAPVAARADRNRTVADAEWEPANSAVPGFNWPEDASWARDREARIEEARRRLQELSERSALEPIRQTEWDEAVRRELNDLNRPMTESPRIKKATFADALTPRVLTPGRARYRYTERMTQEDGSVARSFAEVRGTVREEGVVFFDVRANRWRVCEAAYDTWWVSKVTRE